MHTHIQKHSCRYSKHTGKLALTALCYVVAVVVVDPGAPPDGHVSRARFHSAGSPAAHEEEPGENHQNNQ